MTHGTHATLATDRATVVRAHHRRTVRSTARDLVIVTWYIGVWVWLVGLAITALMAWVDSRGVGDIELPGYAGAVTSVRIYLLIMGIILPMAMIAVHLAAGGTRRSFVHGLLTAAAVCGLTFGLVGTAILLLEWWITGRDGPAVTAGDQLLTDGSQVPAVLVLQVSAAAAYLLTGMAISAGYYRFGGLRGTAFLVPALLPLVLLELSLDSGVGTALAPDLVGGGRPAVSVLGALAAVVLAAVLVHLTLRRVAVRPPGAGSAG